MAFLSADGIALLEALKAQGYGIEIRVLPRREGKDEVYDVELSFPKRATGQTGGSQAASRPTQGKKAPRPEDTPPAAPSTVVGPPPGVDPVVFMKGRLALARIAGFMTQLNVSNDTLQRHALALLVLKEKIKNGEQADWFDPNRPAAESNADIDLALRIIADHHAQIQVFRSHVLPILALAGAMEAPSALDELRQELEQERARAQSWQATHKQPTADDYGVKPEALPTPDVFVQKLDVNFGMLAPVIKTAQGVATGSPQLTLDGLAALAPEDRSVGIVLQGLSAAGHGDIQGTLESVAKLTGHEAEVQDITERLGRVGSVLKTLRGLTWASRHTAREVASNPRAAAPLRAAPAQRSDAGRGAGQSAGLGGNCSLRFEDPFNATWYALWVGRGLPPRVALGPRSNRGRSTASSPAHTRALSSPVHCLPTPTARGHVMDGKQRTVTRIGRWFRVAVFALAIGCARSSLSETGNETVAEVGTGGDEAGAAGGGSGGHAPTGGTKSTGDTKGTGGTKSTGGMKSTGGTKGTPGTGGIQTQAGTAGHDQQPGGRGEAGAPSSGTGGSSGTVGDGCLVVDRPSVGFGVAGDPIPPDVTVIDSGLDAPPNDALPPVVGHHVLFRRGSQSRTHPVLAMAGSALGVAFVEGTKLRFAVSNEKPYEADSFGFTDIAEAISSALEPMLVGDADGFEYGWTYPDDSGSAQVLSVRLDTQGNIIRGPVEWVNAYWPDCAMSSGAETVALTCVEQRPDDASYVTWVELCPREGSCIRCPLWNDDDDSLRPSITWDGAAFDIVYPGSSTDNGVLWLTRMGVSGEKLLAPVDVYDYGWQQDGPLAVTYDGENLALVRGRPAELYALDLEGRVVKGPWDLPDGGLDFQILPDSSGYVILSKLGPDTTYPWSTALWWVSAATALPEESLLAPESAFGPGATAGMVRAGESIITIREAQDSGAPSTLVLARFHESDHQLERDPELFGPLSGVLQPTSLRCDASFCNILAHEPSPGLGYPERSYGLWRIERKSDRVIARPAAATANGFAVAVPAMSSTEAATVLVHPTSASPPELVFWGYDGSLSKAACPAGFSERNASLYFEDDALRLFYGNVLDTTFMSQALFVDDQFGSSENVGSTYAPLRCGNAYYAVSSEDSSSILRWRPKIDSKFLPAFVGTASVDPSAWCCNEKLLGALAIDDSGAWMTFITSLEGEQVASFELAPYGCAPAGDSLVVVAPWPYANGLLLEQTLPNGEIRSRRLTLPDGLSDPGPNVVDPPWALYSDGTELVLAWYASDSGDALLSTWPLE